MSKALFVNEADLCAQFVSYLPTGWTAYPESAGFDLLLVREDGTQIGVEAKMTLNAKVLLQAVEGLHARYKGGVNGPDYRAALVPYGTAGADMSALASRLGVTVIECKNERIRLSEIEKRMERYEPSERDHVREYVERWSKSEFRPFTPELPKPDDYDWKLMWNDLCPHERCEVPDYVPDVVAGASGPSQLSKWKIKAIKICILLEKRGYVTGMDFIELDINRQRFIEMGWLKPERLSTDKRRSICRVGDFPLDLRKAHPVNYGQIEADFEKWATKEMLEGITL